MKKNGEFNKLIILNFLMLIFFISMLLLGTFNDEAISKTLYSPDNLSLKLITAIGAYPFFAFCVVFSGSLFERTLHSNTGKGLKIFLSILPIESILSKPISIGKTLESLVLIEQ